MSEQFSQAQPGANWTDVTADFIQASKSLSIGELVTIPKFDLFSGVRALEVSYFKYLKSYDLLSNVKLVC